jgi:hypothetical protein
MKNLKKEKNPKNNEEFFLQGICEDCHILGMFLGDLYF